MIVNPILPGFNPDPCICRKGDDYYMAVSTFEWFPGIPVYHSRDLKNWELYTHVITDDEKVDLKKLPSAKGIWAPCLTYCEEEDMFYVVYGVMNSMNARYFDVDNFLICAKDIRGPWSEPVYLHSSGFDASLFHDTNGKKYVVSLEWETREGYEKPGAICMVEYSPEKKETAQTEAASRHRISQNEASIITSCVQRVAQDTTTALLWDVLRMYGDHMKKIRRIPSLPVFRENPTSARIQTI